MSAQPSLAERQSAFMRAILDEDAPLPDGWGNSQAAGMAVYRGNYRSALMDALADTFERTKLYVGDGPFAQAAAHHAIANPPSGWTIDDTGHGFDETCAQLFANNPEVSELAWLEWTMLGLATAPDHTPLDAAGFAAATQGLDDQGWSALRFEFQPRIATRMVEHNLSSLWNAIGDGDTAQAELGPRKQRGCIVWREGVRPTFMLVDPAEAQALASMQAGASYGEMLVELAQSQKGNDRLQQALKRAGKILGQWLGEGMITRVIS